MSATVAVPTGLDALWLDAGTAHGWTHPPIAPSDLEAVSFRATGHHATAEGICFLKRYIRLLRVHEHTPPAIRLIAPNDEVQKQRCQYNKGRASTEPRARITLRDDLHPLPETKRAHLGRLEPHWSQQVVLEARIGALEALRRKARPDGRLTEDDRLDAVLIERDNGPYDDVDVKRLAHIYGVPPKSIENWLRWIPDPRDGLYDEDQTEPARKRGDLTTEFNAIGIESNGYKVEKRSGGPKGRPKDEASPAIIECATGWGLGHCKSLLAKPKQGTMQAERHRLDHMLANIVKRGEMSIAQMARLLDRDRRTIERACTRGDREPTPYAGAPVGWKHSPVTTRHIDPERRRNVKPAVELERPAIYGTAPVERAPLQLPRFDLADAVDDEALAMRPSGDAELEQQATGLLEIAPLNPESSDEQDEAE